MPAMVSIRLGLLEGIFGAANVALGFFRSLKQGLEHTMFQNVKMSCHRGPRRFVLL